jgi:hypothetical protein
MLVFWPLRDVDCISDKFDKTFSLVGKGDVRERIVDILLIIEGHDFIYERAVLYGLQTSRS